MTDSDFEFDLHRRNMLIHAVVMGIPKEAVVQTQQESLYWDYLAAEARLAERNLGAGLAQISELRD